MDTSKEKTQQDDTGNAFLNQSDRGDVGRVPPKMQDYFDNSTDELAFGITASKIEGINREEDQLVSDENLDDLNDETFNTGPVGDDWQMSTDFAALIEKEKGEIKTPSVGGAQGESDDNEEPVLNDLVRVASNADDDDDEDDDEVFLTHKGPIETEDDEDEEKIVSKFSKLFSTGLENDPSKIAQAPVGPDAAWNLSRGPTGFGTPFSPGQPSTVDPIARLFGSGVPAVPPSPHKVTQPAALPPNPLPGMPPGMFGAGALSMHFAGMQAMPGLPPNMVPNVHRVTNRMMSVEELEARLMGQPPNAAGSNVPNTTTLNSAPPIPPMAMGQMPIPGNSGQFMFPHGQQMPFPPFLPGNPQAKGFLPPGLQPMHGQLGFGQPGSGLPLPLAGLIPPAAPSHQIASPQKPQILNSSPSHHGPRDFQEQRQMHLANQRALSAKLGPKKMMSPSEIEMIISQHHQQITTSPSPYMDDYYYLCWSRKNGESGGTVDSHARIQALNHHPICLSTPPRAAKRQVHNPEGVLGRIPTHSVRSPRVLLQLKNDKASANTGEEDVNNGAVYAMHLVLHRIEDAFNWLLDLEDLALLAKNLPPQAEHLTLTLPGSNPLAPSPNDTTINFGQKKRELARELFKTLGVFMVGSIDIDADNVDIDPNSRYFPENFSVSGESKCNFEEDELFVCIFFSSKGKKLLSRAMRFFSTTQTFWVSLVFLRNLSLVVSNPAASTEDLKLSALVFDELCAGVSKFGLSQLTKCLNSIVSFQTDFVGSLLKQTGIQLVSAVLKRALQLLTVHKMAMWQGVSQSHVIWKESFDLFYEQLAGQFATLLAPPIPQDNSTIPTSTATQTQIFEFLLLMALQESEPQKKAMFAEIVPLFQTIDTSDPFVQRFIQISTQG